MRKTVIFLSLAIFLFVGCDKLLPSKEPVISDAPPPIRGTLLAQVNDWAIGTEDFRDRIEALKSLYPDIGTLDVDTQKKTLQEWVNLEILSQIATEQGLDKDYDVKDAVRDFKRTLLVDKLRENILRNITVTSAEVENFYNTNQLIFKEPEQRKISEIVVPTESRAKDILIKLLQGESFASLARSYSTAPSASKGGDLGYIVPDPEKLKEKFQKFWEVAFTTDKGETSSYFRGPDGSYYIVKVEDVKGGKLKPLSEVRTNIEAYLKNDKIQKELEDLIFNAKQKYKVVINEYLLEY